MNWTKNTKLIKGIALLLGGLLFAAILYYANHDRPGYFTTRDSGAEYELARVLEVLEDKTNVDAATEDILKGSMKLQLEVLSGRYKGDVVEVTNYLSYQYNVVCKKGDRISVRIDTSADNTYTVSVNNYDRTYILSGMVLLFCLAVMVIGGKQGVKAIVGLVFTFISIIFLLVPLVLKGFSPIPTTVVIIAITTVISFLLIGGIQSKTVAAFLGSMLGVIMAAVIALAAGKFCHVTGFQMEDSESLVYIKFDTLIHVKGLFISGVLIASIGAVMDIAMSVSSAVNELHVLNPALTVKELFRSGMNIGRDAMGTMANTLILAFAGTSLNMIILIYSYGVSFTQLINTDFVAVEIIRSIAGSLGIVFTVPAAALISAYCCLRNKKSN
ncbi:MAG: YibE/F family protein [bacterium]|nr:YibE/F family protein [bacterium]